MRPRNVFWNTPAPGTRWYAATQDTRGLAASGDLDPESKYPSMFESIHDSPPDIAGKRAAKPTATIRAAAMTLNFPGHEDMGGLVILAIDQTLLEDAPKPVDLSGTASTCEVGEAVCDSSSIAHMDLQART